MEIIKEILDILDKYLEHTSICIDRKQTNNKIIRFVDRTTNVRINIHWDDIFFFVLNDDVNFQKLHEILKGRADIGRIFSDISRDKLYSIANGPNFKLWGAELSYFANRVIQGFHKNSEKYAEFIVEVNNDSLYDNNIGFEDVSEHLMYNFKIGNVNISISQPSDIFKLIFLQNAIFNDFNLSWEETITIKFTNLRKSERESILQQAIFLMNLHNSNFLVFGMSKRNRTQIDMQNYNFSNKLPVHFPKAHYFEPISFYNVGLHSSAEMRFLYFYKVLEFFFPIAKQQILSETSNSYDESDDCFKATRHEQMLARLLTFPTIKEEVSMIAESVLFLEIIEKKRESGYLYSGDISDEFAKELYRYRNKVVHSMENSRRLPKLLDVSYKYDFEVMELWNKSIKRIALIVIKYFCYDGLDIETL